MTETVLKIEGMTCMHCKMSVEKALMKVVGVTSVQVDLVNKQAIIVGSAEQAVLAKAISDAGFNAVS
ncbi:MAG: heavy metal-associated domain-containing protein [Desulfosporosinus sp.]|nr:heavy metal-associated domain-containing protein [Desulfosporosinus sp.]